MTLPAVLSSLRLPVIGAPLFIVSNPDLVIAQCKAGVVGSFPALNARPRTTATIPTRPLRRSRSTRSSTARTTGSKPT